MPLVNISEAEKTANYLRNFVEGTLRALRADHIHGFNVLWNNEHGADPQEILDHLGSDAVELFILSQKLGAFISEMDPSYEPLETPNHITVNVDGTVDVGDPI